MSPRLSRPLGNLCGPEKAIAGSHESGFEIREDITDDGLLAAAATLAATMLRDE